MRRSGASLSRGKTEADDASSPTMDGEQRLDKWLWFARLVKTRTLAARLIGAGKVRINRQKVTKPAYIVRAGDVVSAALPGGIRILKICAPGTRRGPAAEAHGLYEDMTPQLTPSESDPPSDAPPLPGVPAASRSRGAGRPTKRERRRLDRLRADPGP